jgi:WD40 repeat protein
VVVAKQRAEAQLGQLLLERGQRELLAGAPSAALAYLAEAVRRGVDSPEARFLVAEAERGVDGDGAGFAAGAGLLAARLAPDGAWLATAAADGVRLWNVATGRATQLADRPAAALITSSDGRRLLTGELCEVARIDTALCDPALRLWDPAQGRLVALLPHAAPVTRAFFGAGAVHSYAGGRWYRWDSATGQLRDRGVPELASAPDQVATPSGTVATVAGHSFDHGAALAMVRADAGGDTVATVGADGLVRVWDAATGVERGTFDGQGAPLLDAVLSDDGRRLYTVGAGGAVKIWRSDRRLVHAETRASALRTLSLSDDGRAALVDQDGRAQLLDLASGAELARTDGVAAPGRLARFRRGGHLLFDDVQGALFDWDPAGARLEPAPQAAAVSILAAAGDAVVGVNGELATLGQPPHARIDGHALTLSDDGARVVGVADAASGAVGVWDTRTGARLAALPVAIAPTLARADLVLAPAGDRMAIMSGDRRVQLRTLPAGTPLGTITVDGAIAEVDWAADGARVVVVASDVTVWRADGARLVTLRAPAGTITTAAFSPDGERVLTGARSGTAQLWDAATGELLSALGPFGAPVDRVAFARSGDRALVAAGPARALWNVAADRGAADGLDARLAALPVRFDGVRVVPRAVAIDRPDPPSLLRALFHFAAAGRLIEARRFADATGQYLAAYDERPWPGYLFYAGHAAAAAGDEARAEGLWARYRAAAGATGLATPAHASRSDHDRMTAHFEVGEQRYEQGRYAEAAAEFLTAASFFPAPSLFFNAAVCYERTHDWATAAAMFTRYLELNPVASDRQLVEQRLAALRQQLTARTP